MPVKSTYVFPDFLVLWIKGTREQTKVSNGFKKRCCADFPDFSDWDIVYGMDEQLIRIADYITFGTTDSQIYSVESLPHEMCAEYKECIEVVSPSTSSISILEMVSASSFALKLS